MPPSIQAGGKSLSRKVWSIGECGASNGAKTAMMTITEMMTIGIQGTRAVRRGAASRRGHTMARHRDQRRWTTVRDGRSTIATACLPRHSVILSAAKDLMPFARGDEILRCAQDDSIHHANLILGSTYA
ncbi:hypothetical protein RSO01_71220 [Reyranella soli]|uniref:Uncharacterized protein n=1 Tax=Reyranella soli TaxID=1230389 RepID=A0A512NLY9_9HYPH|nr:hypothetical protein RSO01_71220 [Reyranella soli]